MVVGKVLEKVVAVMMMVMVIVARLVVVVMVIVARLVAVVVVMAVAVAVVAAAARWSDALSICSGETPVARRPVRSAGRRGNDGCGGLSIRAGAAPGRLIETRRRRRSAPGSPHRAGFATPRRTAPLHAASGRPDAARRIIHARFDWDASGS